jgi:hypothetical protein
VTTARCDAIANHAPSCNVYSKEERGKASVRDTDGAFELAAQAAGAGEPDHLRAIVQDFAEAPMGAEVDAFCARPVGERSAERVNKCNGYRERG